VIEDYTKFQLPDINNENNLIAEVNWEDKEATNKSKVIKITFPDGKHMFLKREDLNQILFAIGDPESQRRLIPQTLTTVHWYESVVGVTVKEDIPKGGKVRFPVKFSVACNNVKQVIGDKLWSADQKRLERSGLVVPKS